MSQSHLLELFNEVTLPDNLIAEYKRLATIHAEQERTKNKMIRFRNQYETNIKRLSWSVAKEMVRRRLFKQAERMLEELTHHANRLTHTEQSQRNLIALLERPVYMTLFDVAAETAIKDGHSEIEYSGDLMHKAIRNGMVLAHRIGTSERSFVNSHHHIYHNRRLENQTVSATEPTMIQEDPVFEYWYYPRATMIQAALGTPALPDIGRGLTHGYDQP